MPEPTIPQAASAMDRDGDRRLRLVLLLNFLIPAAQIVGGLLANSVALVSDAVHNFSDFTAVLIAYLARVLARRPPSPRSTFGYQRLETLAVLVNVGLLCGAAAFIIYEALKRLWHPEPVAGWLVMAVAGVGVLGNGLSTWLLAKDSKQSLNLRGAFLHMLGDFLISLAVLVSGLVLAYHPWYWLDPLLSLAIAILISKNSFSLLRQAAAILMNLTPSHLDLDQVRGFLESQPEVIRAHHLHAWSISERRAALSAHLLVTDRPLSQVDVLADSLRRGLAERFGVDHVTLQFETISCEANPDHCAVWE